MAARLRVLAVSGEQSVLVLDRTADNERWVNLDGDEMAKLSDRLTEMAQRIGMSGAFVFREEIDLPD